MGYYTGVGLCGMCDSCFIFNPERVPCFPIKRPRPRGIARLDPRGTLEPVCKPCFDRTNELRKEHGLEPNAHLSGAWEKTEALG